MGSKEILAKYGVIEDNDKPVSEIRQMPSALERNIINPAKYIARESFIKPGKDVYGSFLKGSANAMDTLDFYSDKIAKFIGVPETKDSVFEILKDNWNFYGDKLEKEGLPEGLMKKIYQGLGSAGFEVPKLMALGPQGLIISGAAEGGKEGGVKGSILGGIEGGLTKGILKGLNKLPAKIKYPAAFGFGTTTTPGGIEEKVAGGVVMTSLSVGKSPSMKEFKETQVKYSPIPYKYLSNKAEDIYQRIFNRFQSLENLPDKRIGKMARGYLGIGGKVESVLKDKTYKMKDDGTFEITGEGLIPILDDYDKLSPEKNRDVREKDADNYQFAKRTIYGLQRPEFEGSDEYIVSPEQVKNAKEILTELDKKYNPVETGVIPDFKNTREALVYGNRIKGNIKQIEMLNKNRNELLKKTNEIQTLGDKMTDVQLQEGFNIATKAQFLREAVEAAEGKSPDVLGIPKESYISIPHLEQTAQRRYDYRSRILHLLVDSGNLSQAKFDKILSKNPYYVSFEKILDEIDLKEGGSPVSKGIFTKAKSPLKTIKGSELENKPSIETDIKNTYRIMDIAERNTIWNAVYNLKEKPELGIEEVKIPNEKTIQTMFGQSPFKPKGKVLEGYVDGKRTYMKVSDNLYDSMSGLNETSVSLLTKILSVPAKTLRTGSTITPEFISRNLIRDQWVAFIQTKLGYKPFIDPPKAIADIMNKTNSYYDWMRSGGMQSGFSELSRQNIQKTINDLRNRPSLLKSLNIITKAQDISQLFEQATRLGVYKAGIKKGLSPLEAGFESRESTIDFARRGSQTKDINAVTAFFNAGLQGTDKFIRTTVEDPAGVAVKGITTITIPSIISYLLNKDDPDYQELPRWQKDLFWIYKVNGTFVRIPKPFVYGQIFGSMPERFLDYLSKEDSVAFEGLIKSIYDSVSPISGSPEGGLLITAIKPLIENDRNWSYFRERPVVPKPKLSNDLGRSVLPPYQYGRYTTETAKRFGKLFNYSPSKIDNLVFGWTGGAGRYALEGSDLLLGSKKEKRPSELADIPLIKGFVTRNVSSENSESVTRFYENADKILQIHSTYNFLKKDNIKEALDLIRKYPEIKYAPAINITIKQIREIDKKIDEVVKSNISEGKKRLLLNNLDRRKINIAVQVNKLVK